MLRFFLASLLIVLTLSCEPPKDQLRLERDEDGTTILLGRQPLVCYVHSETPEPEGQSPLYRRSAYIHPLYSRGGMVLTRIQPPDHYHHYGIWNPWTRVSFDDRTVDFWNLDEGQGTVRFAEYLEQHEDEKEAGFSVRHEHIYFNEDGSEGLALNEVWKLRVHDVKENSYALDMEVLLSTPLEGGVTLNAYRYGGGLGYRATEKWNNENSTVFTSQGRTRADADSTRARWVIIEGESSVPQGRSGILFLSHPDNHAHPESMRVWPPENHEGSVYFEFCPIREKEWVLEQDREYTLRYRMIVFDGGMGAGDAQIHWNKFSSDY
jgi:hypothetical protein